MIMQAINQPPSRIWLGGTNARINNKTIARNPNPETIQMPVFPPGIMNARGTSGCVYLRWIAAAYMSKYITIYTVVVKASSIQNALLTPPGNATKTAPQKVTNTA